MRRVFYLCPTAPRPRGGIKQVYRHVDVLARAGYDATVVHFTPGVRMTWFPNETPVIDHATFLARLRPAEDFVVVAETFGAQIAALPGRRVMFDQNVYGGFGTLGHAWPRPYPYDLVEAILVVSEHNAELLRFAFPDLPVLRVYNHVDDTRFRSRPLRDKRRRIVAIAGKCEAQLRAIAHALEARGRAGGAEWLLLDGRTEAEVAELLAESLLVVFPSVEEGLALFPIEAMLAGCVTILPACGSHLEHAPADFLAGDLVAMAAKLEEVLTGGDEVLARYQPICDAARARLAAAYSREREETSVLAAWEQVFAR